MRVLMTGATGLVGRFIAEGLSGAGHEVIRLGRTGADIGWTLGREVNLPPARALVHCAFDHVPGAYRGGEGDDPAGFWHRNFDGTSALLADARRVGVGVFVFLSSRAVYDGAAGLNEGAMLAPESLYGRLKLETEKLIAAEPGMRAVSLRATGVFGRAPGGGVHKWQGLFDDYLAGRNIAPRAATEVHGRDLAAAVDLVLGAPVRGAFNVSDIVLDRADLLAEVARMTGCAHPLPTRDCTPVRAMPVDRLRALGWSPEGWARLRADLPGMLAG